MHRGNIDVVIVNWNGRPFLQRCIESVLASSVSVDVVVVDNCSGDGSADFVRATFPTVTVISAPSNIGYAAGANLGLRHGNAPYAFVMNPDVVIAPDYLEILCARLDSDARIGVAQGKLFNITKDAFISGSTEGRIIDSAGHVIRRSRMVVDRGHGLPDSAELSVEASVFSACGAAIALRREMLADIAADGEYFDQSFFAYKEDIDLCWRARLRGWDVRYVPAATAYHVRALAFGRRAWKQASVAARRHSWKNHYLLMIRNDRLSDLVRSIPYILAWEILRLGHALLRDPAVLPAYLDLVRNLGRAFSARRVIQARRQNDTLRRWFGSEPLPITTRSAAPALAGSA